MNSKKAVIFTGGLGPEYIRVKKIIESSVINIAADSGWDLAVGMGVIPDYYIGDMDSISDHAGLSSLPAERVMKYPVDKDYTDTELAIKYLDENDYRDIVLIGGGGGRIDHLMALLSMFNGDIRPAEWFTASEHIIYADKNCGIESVVGRTVSIFQCGLTNAVISSTGLKWELKKYEMNQVKFSISNIAVAESFSLEIHSGAVLIMLNY